MRVYRVENEYGDGPYGIVFNGRGLAIGSAHSDSEHPCPSEDILRWALYGHKKPFNETGTDDKVFGMNSLASLLIWFEGWWEILEGYGYAIEEYEVPDEYVAVGASGEQVVFMRSRAERLD